MSRRRERWVVIGNGMAGFKLLELAADSRLDGARVTVFGEEPRPAYDRVHLTEYLAGRTAEDLLLAPRSWYRRQGFELHTHERVIAIDRAARTVATSVGRKAPFDRLVLATGSAPFRPPIPGLDGPAVFTYRTIEDLDAIRAAARGKRSAAVLGGGLLGLEAAKALYDLGLETHVLEVTGWLMARQLDAAAGDMLRRAITRLGVRVHTGAQVSRVRSAEGEVTVEIAGGGSLTVDLFVVSAGIAPRDELARAAGLEVGPRGGIVVDDAMRTTDPAIYAIGECALHRGTVYGLIGPCHRMAEVALANLLGETRAFAGADLSTRLKLLGVEVATVGNAVAAANDARQTTSVTLVDELQGVYKRLLVDTSSGTLAGAILVGSAADYPRLLRAYRAQEKLPERPVALVVAEAGAAASDATPDALVCTCNGVARSALVAAIREGAHELGELCARTQAGTGCGGCKPIVAEVLRAELAALGVNVRQEICPHFAFSRRELLEIVKVRQLRRFDEVLEAAGRGGAGCEVCQPVVASILASVHAETANAEPVIQDTNDRFLANIQRGGTYSVVPRVPGGEITPEKLVALGHVAKRYDLYCKITGAQRVDLFGARVDQLPDIWEELIAAGFESGHAYAKGMRTVKSCVGSTWCRFGVLDSTGFAVRLEHRYKGLRSPHKLKAAVSGCIRECAEARAKDFGVIATEDGWNLYVCGNGGARPRHAEILASGLDDDTCVRYINRFLLYYIHTADPLTRTATWLDQLEGGIEYLRKVIVEDHLGVAADLEAEMQRLIDEYRCEWREVVEDPVRRARFRAFVNVGGHDRGIAFVREREQKRPASGGGFVELERNGRADREGASPCESCVPQEETDHGRERTLDPHL